MDDITHVAILLVKAAPGLPIIGAAAGRAKVLGYDPQALSGMPLSLLCPLRQPDGRPSAETLDGVLAQVSQTGALSLPWSFQTRTGETRPHELHLTLTERDGEAQIAVCMVDVSRMQFAEVPKGLFALRQWAAKARSQGPIKAQRAARTRVRAIDATPSGPWLRAFPSGCDQKGRARRCKSSPGTQPGCDLRLARGLSGHNAAHCRSANSPSAKNELLEMVATGKPLTPVLNRLTTLIEAQFDGLYCTVLLLDLEGRHVRVGAGPRMPAEYMQALEGIAIGPTVGSCGTAMFDDRLVIVDDIATHPLWAQYRDLALPYGFKACWSAPIHGTERRVIGSFAMYYREVRRPTPDELSALNTASHLAGIAIDQERRAEERRRAAQWLEEQVQARTAELLAAQEELVNGRKLAALGQLLSGIAHELNTPLGNALLSASALRAGGASFAKRMAGDVPLKRQELADWVAQTRAGTELIEQNVDRALRLVERFRQLTDGAGRAERTQFDLREAVLRAWARVAAHLDVEHVRLACELPEGVRLDGYPDVLQQVLEQLLENACLHAFRDGRAGLIEVRARCNAASLTLEVRDNGIGMPAADVARAFEPFFTTTFGQGGSGLGLFVAHSLVTGMLGGSLQLDSQPGEGTVARLELPKRGGAVLALAA